MAAQALIDRYRDQLQKLLPPGLAFNRRDGSNQTDWVEAIAVEYADVHEDIDALLLEAYPGDATLTAGTGLLTDWETLCSLPDECTYLLTALADRQAAVLQHFAVEEGQSEANFQSLASDYGYTPLHIGLYGTSRCGVMRCGQTQIRGPQWLFASQMSYAVADPADTASDAALECLLDQHKHAYAHINWNSYDRSTVTGITGLRHWFEPNEVTLVGGTGSEADVISVWPNTSGVFASDRWNRQGAFAETCVGASAFGWLGCDGWDEADDGARELGGMNIRTSGNDSGSSFIVTNDITMFMVVDLREIDSGLNAVFLQNADETFQIKTSGTPGVAPVKLNAIRGATTYQVDLDYSRFVITYADDGINVRLQVNDDTATLSAVVAAPTENDLKIGDAFPSGFDTSFHGTILEMITFDYLGSQDRIDVRDYLMAKYL